MPRKSRIDAPDAMHHIIARGIERCKIFRDDADCNNFLDRLGVIIDDTGTVCFAWALIPNHYHYTLFLTTGVTDVTAIFFKTDTNLSYARKMLICWNWYDIST